MTVYGNLFQKSVQSIHRGETQQHQLKTTNICQKIEIIWNNDEVLDDIIKHWEIKLAFYHISRCQNTLREMRHLNT